LLTLYVTLFILEPMFNVPGHTGSVRSVDWSRQETSYQMCSAGNDGRCLLWDVRDPWLPFPLWRSRSMTFYLWNSFKHFKLTLMKGLQVLVAFQNWSNTILYSDLVNVLRSLDLESNKVHWIGLFKGVIWVTIYLFLTQLCTLF
jgi:WD40 repeat protein